MKVIWYLLGGTLLVTMATWLTSTLFLAPGDLLPARYFADVAATGAASAQAMIPSDTLAEDQADMSDERNAMMDKDETRQAPSSSTVVGTTLFDFAGDGPAWYTVNDDVMGGISSSLASTDPETQRLVFSGNLSLENNGGFASVRSQWSDYDLTGYDGIVLRVRGDGRTYQFRVRAEETGSEIAYAALLETEAGRWKDIYVSFEEMVPVYRGVVVSRAPALNPESIRSFGFMLADRQEGEFTLEVEMLSAVVAGNRQV